MTNNRYQTIGQLAKRTGLRTSALRYYEEKGLLQPVA
ncbi:MAG: MerR family DNA-binding transcriptional regulator, partial [Caldilineaceae bacterium]|nr:MerR family DNA-binding transcriptional regulator [Caldilineaceae bacterium]